MDVGSICVGLLALFTVGVVVYTKSSASEAGDAAPDAHYGAGLAFSFLALCGNTGASLLRKRLSSTGTVSPALMVGAAALAQGAVAVAYCAANGLLESVALAFILPAVASSVLNALTKTLETRAYATTDVSLCAPFLAFDPVMQFLVPAVLAPVACWVSKDAGACAAAAAATNFPAYHPLAVCCVAAGAFLVARCAAPAKGAPAKRGASGAPQMVGPLPLGAWLILFNCVVYAFTSRLDKLAIGAAGKALYFAYGRLLIALTCFAGARPSGAEVRALAEHPTATLLCLVCVAEAVYMLALYQAFAYISPVYVTAIKRGGGVLVSSAASFFLLKEPSNGKLFPILVVVFGTVALCV
ncbi:hypothetical protein M885DRAFT_584046 [Pelagophyceae sp. CCMP2097]|nr:hypothetical protein M885DRAFT_584046 [Pelagophyceae sp. CCMP2097]|mmetsp:Transcript_10903/g.38455  ORF Transcript_10903/g.38455 Transcript_10903/m.38455 type:complete len:355 (+) Transcript_10903:70-1134(+)|eukprot:CAMPEP_0206819256 /NCGR_PEP_ID=MMETSP0975-20121206/11216_1 /ASSEMBLY_ACC=CAM_ASM_000399 /TAXON_ID=483370 /ORGANISM="non described non described, Strain CCMP2097" /LENGTH=354 /DNA_ID=CAMNT_0054361477 /DNA_START=39 /DNA_END=1103 /DNA_ORIENTATION=+